MPSNMNNKLDPMFSSSSSRREFPSSSNSCVGKSRTMSTSSNATSMSNYNRKISVGSAGSYISTTSSEFSDIDFADSTPDDVISTCSDDDCQEVVKKILQHERPMRITIKLHVTESKYTKWDTVLNPKNNILYVVMPEVLPPEASKQSFISLLEFADEKLDVDAVVLCMRKDRKDRSRLLQTFLILGFQPLSRKSPFAPPAEKVDNNNCFLIYNIEE